MKRIYVIVGPSGSGKNTLGNHLIDKGIPELVSHTTRAMRVGEVHGINYYYVNKEEFDKIDKVESSNYAGNFYCLSKKEVESKLQKFDTVFVVADIDGMRQIKKMYPEETTSLFILVTKEEMIERMKARGDLPENIEKRIQNSIVHKELENWQYCDYIIRNDNVKDALKRLEDILAKSQQYAFQKN